MTGFKRIIVMSAVAAAAVFSVSQVSFAQDQNKDPKKEAEMEKKLDEAIQNMVSRYESTLKLEDWQTFYVDSILNHDYRAMQEEVNKLSSAKVSNTDLYVRAQDKWSEKIYNAFHKVLDENQWTKYLKMGAAKEAKAREKRKSENEGK